MTDEERRDPEDESSLEEDHPERDPITEKPEHAGSPHKRFRAATDEELDPQSYFISDDRSALRAVLRGGSISGDRGDADFIGGAIRRLARALREAAQNYQQAAVDIATSPVLRRVKFGHSVVVELEVGLEESVDRGLDGSRHAPTVDAARALGQLLAADSDELVPRALLLGGTVVAEYKRFLNLLAEDDVTLEWQAADATEIVVLTSVDARHDYVILDSEGERAAETVTMPGTLTMADSRRHRFELSLPSGLARPTLLKGKSLVEGDYSDDMGMRLKAEGLWDTEVMATVEVSYDVPGTTPTPRDPSYRLINAEPVNGRDAPTLFD